MHFIYLQCTLSKHSDILLQQLLRVSGQKKQICMESNKIVFVEFDTLVILRKWRSLASVRRKIVPNYSTGCLPRHQSLTHHDITAGSHSDDDSNLLYHIVNDLRKKGKKTSDYKATERYSLKKEFEFSALPFQFLDPLTTTCCSEDSIRSLLKAFPRYMV